MSGRNSPSQSGLDCPISECAEEGTPLLLTPQQAKHDELLYSRFSPLWKRLILAMVSFCGLIPLFISGTFIPCIPQISEDLSTTGTVVSMAVSVSIFGASVGLLFASTYSTFYGRRPIYLSFLPLLIFGSLGVSTAQNVTQLMIWRLIQAFGAAPGLSVGAGVIGDIYKLEERGGAMGIYFGCVLLGPALAPVVGGVAARYGSWRLLPLSLGAWGVLVFLVMYAYFPETSHPGERGIDKMKHDGNPNATWTRWLPVMLNPLRPLGLMRRPNLLFVCLAGLFTLFTDYALLVPIAYTIGKRYGIADEAVIGACFLPAGLGNMIGAALAGRFSDSIIVRMRAKRGGVWYPEDRLRGTLPSALILVPISIWASGFITKYVENKRVGLSLNLVCLFVNGLGVDFVLAPSASYVVDVMHSRSAESMAANSAFRSVIMSALVGGILPMVENYGVLATDLLSGLAALIGFGLLWVTIQHGERLRKWGADEGQYRGD
ncbi:MFS general substrate transporter [Ephemerocybe angulata]|uniref:MFS general substrate transporter n=1 Tax=Ephemerocybe angulata TaxID=980116 RepID=A0A8H6MD39_9AGAR|nr:MFS general substrate transporter [Tulosesus angulatus]